MVSVAEWPHAGQVMVERNFMAHVSTTWSRYRCKTVVSGQGDHQGAAAVAAHRAAVGGPGKDASSRNVSLAGQSARMMCLCDENGTYP